VPSRLSCPLVFQTLLAAMSWLLPGWVSRGSRDSGSQSGASPPQPLSQPPSRREEEEEELEEELEEEDGDDGDDGVGDASDVTHRSTVRWAHWTSLRGTGTGRLGLAV
jgi:hypothetical protein